MKNYYNTRPLTPTPIQTASRGFHLFLISLFVLLTANLQAQVANYTFNQSGGSYTALSAPTNISVVGWDDNGPYNAVLPFTFYFNNIGYNAVSVNCNGFITFGATISNDDNYVPISSGAGYAGAVSALGRNLINNGSRIVGGVTGTAPNRVAVIQWTNARRIATGSIRAGDFDFQIRLYESSNIVQIVYGNCSSNYTTDLAVQVGLRGAGNSDFNNRVTSNNWPASTAGATNNATCNTGNGAGELPTNGLTYTWTPRPYLITAPTSACVGQSIVLNGYNFLNASAVSFNGTPATSFTVNNANQITVVVPAGATSGTISITTPAGTGGSASALTITAPPTVANLSGTFEVCPGNTTTLGSSPGGGLWTSSNLSVAIVNASGVVSGIASGTSTITYTVTSGSCTASKSAVVTVHALPALSGPSAVCIGSNIQLSPSSGGSWVSNNPSVASISNTGLATGLLPGNATFTFTSATTGCSATTGNINVQNAPAITGHPNASSVCSGSSVSLQVVASGSGLSYQWYRGLSALTNSGNISGANSATLTLNPVDVADAAPDYYCVVSGNCSPSVNSNQAMLSVTESVKITAQPVATQTLCTGNNATISLTATGAGLSYQWHVGGTALTDDGHYAGTQTPTLTINNLIQADGSNNYYCIVSGTAPCNPVTSASSALVVNESPAIADQPTPTIVCAGDTATFTVVASGGNLTYQWFKGLVSLTDGGNLSGVHTPQLTISNTTTAAAGTDYYCVIGNGCLPTVTSNSAALTVNERPFIGNYILSTCSETAFLVIPANAVPTAATVVPSGTTYSWNAPVVTGGMTGGSAEAGQSNIGQTLVNGTAVDQTATYTVTPVSGTSGNCSGASFTVTVTVHPRPFIMNLSPSICSGEALVMSPTNGGGNLIPAGTTYSWSAPVLSGGMTGTGAMSNQPNLNFTFNNPTNTLQTASYNVTATAGGCAGSVFTVAVTVHPKPTLAATPAAQTICSGNPMANIVMSNPNAISGTIDYNWTRDNTTNLTGMANSGNGAIIAGSLVNNSNVAQTTIFTLTATSDQSCNASTITVSVTVNPAPTVAATPATQAVCSDIAIADIVLSNPNNVSGTIYSWTRDNTTNVTGIAAFGSGSPITGMLTNATLMPQTVMFTITASAAGCGTSTTTATVIVNPRPDVAASPATQTVCAGIAIGAITITNPNALPGATISWTRNNTANTPGIAASGTSAAINGTLTNPTNIDQTTTFTITTTRAGCASAAVTVDVVVRPTPLAVATPATQSICTGQAASINFSTSNSLTGTTFNWTRNNTANISGLAGSGSGNISATLTNSTAVAQTTLFTIIASAPNGCTRTITASITVNPTMSTPGIEDSQVVCQGSRPTTFFITTPITGGSGSYTYQWQSSTTSATGPWTNIGAATNATYQPPTTNGTTPNTWYQVIVSSCGSSVTSNAVLVVVGSNNNFNITLNGGGETLCSGESYDPGIVTGHGTSVYFRYTWIADPAYISAPSGGPIGGTGCFFGLCLSSANFPLTVMNNTNANVTTVISITPVLYDSDTNLPVCSLSPRTFSVTIRPRPVAIATAPNPLICSGTSAGITVTSNVTASAQVRYQWTRNNANFSPAAASGNSGTIGVGNSFTINDILNNNTGSNQTVTYTITPTSVTGNCPSPGTPTTITITVAPQLTPGTIGSSHAVCMGGDPNLLTQLTTAVGSSVSFQWQSSTTSATGPWTDIPGATLANYDPPAPLNQTTWYIRVVSNSVSGILCSVANTAAVQVTVNTMTPGSVNGTQTICAGSNPTVLGSAANGTGSGTVSYQWQSNTSGCGGSFSNITSATGATYLPPAGLSVTTYYRRMTTSAIGANACQDYSNCVTVFVNSVTAGTMGSDQSICGDNPAAFTVFTAATGTGTISYQWQSSTAGCGSGWSNIAMATSATYDAPAGVNVVTYYRRLTISTLNGVACTATGNCITVTPNAVTAGAIGANRTVCMGGDPAAFTQTVAATGPSLLFQWQFSTVSGSGPWTDILGANAATYDAPGPITQVTYYRRVVFNGSCNAQSNFVTVFVNDVTPSVIAGNQSLCGASDPAAFTVVTAASGNGTSLTYQWQRSTVGCSGPWTNIAGALAATYDAPVITQTTYYQVVVTSNLNSVACSAASNCITVAFEGKTWNGSAGVNWDNPTNWSPNGVPTASSCVVIPDTTNKPRVLGSNNNAYAYSLLIMPGAILDITSGNSITVTDAVTVQNTGQFLIKNNAALVQINNVANAGNINMERITQPMYRYDYTYWGSPVTAASNYTLGMLSPQTLSDKYFSWNPTNGSGGAGSWHMESSAMVMNPVKGYIVRAPQFYSTNPATTLAYTANFIGVPNNGNINVPVSAGSMAAGLFDDKLNLLGNPYASAVDADLFLGDPANVNFIDGTIYFWTHHSPPSASYPNPFYGNYVYNYTAGDYATYTMLGGSGTAPTTYAGPVPDGYIAAGQGFFVKALNSGTAVFRNNMRVTGNNTAFFRPAAAAAERHRIWLNMANEQGGFSQTLVGYTAAATLGYDRGYDGSAFSGNFVSFYSLLEDQSLLTVQGRPLPFDQEDQVAMGYNATQANTYTIGIDHLDGLFGEQQVYLEDKTLGIIHDLKQSAYSFSSLAGRFNDRFVLRYTNGTLSTTKANTANGLIAFINDGKIAVTSATSMDEITVFDITGKHIKTYIPTGDGRQLEQAFPYAHGIYLAKILRNGSTITQKLINQP